MLRIAATLSHKGEGSKRRARHRLSPASARTLHKNA
jgi:hypothetical protein